MAAEQWCEKLISDTGLQFHTACKIIPIHVCIIAAFSATEGYQSDTGV